MEKFCNCIKAVKLEYFTYFPFIGWWFTAAFKKDDAYSMEHAKKALVYAAFFAAILLVLGISFAFVSNNERILRMILTVVIYLLNIAYVVLCIIGTKRICGKKDSGFPFLNRFAKIPDFL